MRFLGCAVSHASRVLIAGSVGATLTAGSALAEVAPAHSTAGAAAARIAPGQHKVSRYGASARSEHAKIYNQSVWGVENMKVTRTASGNLIRFSYRVTDPARARAIGEKGSKPALIGQSSHAVLQVPVMDKVGELRQGGEMIGGKEYWMVFSNKGNLVKPGERVSVVIGAFHVDGLLLE
jgi:hypothetical protein